MAPKKGLYCDACSNKLERRKDDNEEAVQERLKVYHRHEQELLDFYKKIGQQVNEINVEKPLNQVFNEFKRVVGLENNDYN